jgi:hypothetical protein
MTPNTPIQSPELVDARLNAYRRLLIGVMTHMAADEAGRKMLESIARDTETVADHEEDPGVMPDAGFAAQNHTDEEIRTIIATALTRAEALSAARTASTR